MPGKIVLLVEPNDRDCREAAALVRGLGYDVIAFADVEAAVAVFAYTSADLVLTSHPLRISDSGRDFAAFVKQESPATRVVGMLARGGSDPIRDSLRTGCDDFLAKPLTLEALHPLLLRLIGPSDPAQPLRTTPRPQS